MHQPQTYTSWKIICESAEDAQALKQWFSSRINLDRVITDTIHTAPDGVEQVQTVPHRLGDCFAEICMSSDSGSEPVSFRLVFQRRPDASRFWKDLMVNVLEEIETAPQKAAVGLDSKGELKPLAPLAS